MHLEKEGSCDKMNSKDSAKAIVSEGKDEKNRYVFVSRESSLLTFETYLFFIRHQC